MSQDIEIIKQNCVEKWKGEFGVDKRLQYFCESFANWFQKLPDFVKPTAVTLIQNLEYYSRPSTNKWLQCLHKKLINSVDDLTDDNTIYTFIKSKDGKSNSSNDYWTEYKAINEVNCELCYENIDAISLKQWEYIKNIVFIDDFSGSGQSFLDELKKNLLRYRGKNVYFIAINIATVADGKIKKFGEQQGINIVTLAAAYHEKAFERGLFEDSEEAKEKICKMSREFKIPPNEHLGFQGCQSLVAFYNNTPNNTLGFIRYDTDGYQSLFPRRNKKKPSWQMMKSNLKKRRKANYNNISRGGE